MTMLVVVFETAATLLSVFTTSSMENVCTPSTRSSSVRIMYTVSPMIPRRHRSASMFSAPVVP